MIVGGNAFYATFIGTANGLHQFHKQAGPRHHVRDRSHDRPHRHGDGRARRGRRDRRLARRDRRDPGRRDRVGRAAEEPREGRPPAGRADAEVLPRRRGLSRAVQRADVRRYLAAQATCDRVLRGARSAITPTRSTRVAAVGDARERLSRRSGRARERPGRLLRGGPEPRAAVVSSDHRGDVRRVSAGVALDVHRRPRDHAALHPGHAALLADLRDGDRRGDGGQADRRCSACRTRTTSRPPADPRCSCSRSATSRSRSSRSPARS